MAQTVIGFFDDASEARKAVERLAESGIGRSNIDIRENTASDTTSVRADRDGEEEGGIARFFKSLFGDNDDEADRYSRVGSNSRCIVTVHAQTDDEAERAADLLDEYGAVDVDERASQYARHNISSDTSDYDTARSSSDDRIRDNDATISRVEENLEVGKREVERGGVRVRSRIVERPVEETLRLREEHVRVERNPVDRPLTDSDRNAFQEQEIELTERAEVPVVNKEARVVEEIRLSKDVDERTETIRDTVRNTEVDVDNVGSDRTNLTNESRLSDDDDDLNASTRKSL